MDDNRSDYTNYFSEIPKDAVVALGNALRYDVPNLVATPTINKSIFLLNRGMRFLKGKPYKTSMGLKLLRGNGWGGHKFLLSTFTQRYFYYCRIV